MENRSFNSRQQNVEENSLPSQSNSGLVFASILLTPLFLGLAIFCSIKTINAFMLGSLFTAIILITISLLFYFLAYQSVQLGRAKMVPVFSSAQQHQRQSNLSNPDHPIDEIPEDFRIQLPKSNLNRFIGRIFNTLYLWFRVILTVLFVGILIYSLINFGKDKLLLIAVCLIMLLFIHYRTLINSQAMSDNQFFSSIKNGKRLIALIVFLPTLIIFLKEIFSHF